MVARPRPAGTTRAPARPLPAKEHLLGDETIEIASRFSTAVGRLALLADDVGHAELQAVHGAVLTAVIRDALDAVEAVYAARTSGVRDWPEQARRVLARIAAVREALASSGVDGATRRLAHGLVQLIEPDRRPR